LELRTLEGNMPPRILIAGHMAYTLQKACHGCLTGKADYLEILDRKAA